jgi:Holliday junction resolvasome RuvABC endonuclease subunit
MNKRFILGVDVGFENTGLILFQVKKGELEFTNCKTIKTEKDNKKKALRVADDDVLRVQKIIKELRDFIFSGEFSELTVDDRLLVICEMPTGGAQGARPNRTMGMATAAVTAFLTLYDIPFETVTPTEVKVSVTGNKTASKRDIMTAVIKVLGGWVEKKETKRKEPNYIYHLGDKAMPEGYFEHIADAYGTVHHCHHNSPTFKIFVQV